MKSMQRSEAGNRSTKKNKIIIDLCSGSGSATGIWQNSGYEVYRYDIVRLENAPYTHLRDLSDPDQCRSIINDHQDHDILLIWASPPCTEYSDANKKNERSSIRSRHYDLAKLSSNHRSFRPRSSRDRECERRTEDMG